MTNEIKLTSAKDIAAAVNQIGEKLKDKGGLKTVFCVACGGSLSATYPLYYLLRQKSKSIHAECISSNEFCYATPMSLGENSLVVLMSRGGATPETVAATHRAKEKGATVITLSIAEDVPLAEVADYHFLYAATSQDDYKFSGHAIILAIGFEILRRFENDSSYPAAVQAFEDLDGIIRSAIEKVTPKAEKWADRYQNDQTIYTIASDPALCVAYCTTICHLMEMEWVDSSAIQSGDFFHGPFEITEKHVPFMLFKTSGQPRYLDERAEKFLKKYTDCLEVIDALDYGAEKIDPAIREYYDSLILFAVGRVYTETLAVYKQHPFLYRKYMFKFDY